MPDKNPPMNILRATRAAEKLGVSRATFYAWQKQTSPYYQASLPHSVPLGKRAVGWLECELDEWLAERAKQRPHGGNLAAQPEMDPVVAASRPAESRLKPVGRKARIKVAHGDMRSGEAS